MCNLALVSYRCDHRDTFLINCPENNPNRLCEPDKRTIMGRYRFDGQCLDCHKFKCSTEATARSSIRNSEIAEVRARQDLSAEDKEHMVITVRQKAAHREQLALEKEAEVADEIQDGRAWAQEHAKTVWNILYHETEGDEDRLQELQGWRPPLLRVIDSMI